VGLRIPPNAPFCTAETRRKRMEEVINILGSLNTWLSYANLAAIIVLYRVIERVNSRIDEVNTRISQGERSIDRVAGQVVSMARRVHMKSKK
jgi:hypothetical protein